MSLQLAKDVVRQETAEAINELEDLLGDAAQEPEIARKLEDLRARAENGEAITEDDINELIDSLNRVDPAKLPFGFDPNELVEAAEKTMDLSEANQLLQDQSFGAGGFQSWYPTGMIVTMPALSQGMHVLLPDGCGLVGTNGQGAIEVMGVNSGDLLDVTLGVGMAEDDTTNASIDSGIYLRNPEGNGTVHYQLSGVNASLSAGQDRKVRGSSSQVIQFDTGTGRQLRFTLAPGSYVFRRDSIQGWNLLKSLFGVTIDNSDNDQPFYVNIDGRATEVAAGQQQTFRSVYPISLQFDRGNGGAAARKQVSEANTTLVVAVDPTDGLWDLYPDQNFKVESAKSQVHADEFRKSMLQQRLRQALKTSTPTFN